MTVKRILGIFANLDTASTLRAQLQQWDVCIVDNLPDAARVLQHQQFTVGVFGAGVGQAGWEELDAFLRRHHRMRWIGLFDASVACVPAVRSIIADHLYDFHTEPVDEARLRSALGHAHGMALLEPPCAAVMDANPASNIHGRSATVLDLRAHIGKIATIDAPVLIGGESGSGKELAAQEIHARSERAAGPFVAINCGAIPPALIHSELFGYERGAFTGALKEKRGLIESASGGSIFLDEIGDLPLDLQTSLLRFLQERVIYRVGGIEAVPVDARVIAASHVDLPQAVAAGRFREDLYYRLNVFPIRVPALRERKDDLPLLSSLVLQRFAAEKNPVVRGISRQALRAMAAYDWPGNVRELINRVRRAMVLGEHRLITADDLGLPAVPLDMASADNLDQSRLHAERAAIWSTLQRCGKNISKSARDLGISRMTLYRLMAKHAINV